MYQSKLFNNLNNPSFLTLIKLINEKQQINKTINLFGNEPYLDWWKFRKNRYITSNYLSITTKEKCAFKVETILSPQVKQILEELTKTIQTSKRDAIRIAIYELRKKISKAENFLKYADKETKERGHTSRSIECSCRVINTEMESVQEIAKHSRLQKKVFFCNFLPFLKIFLIAETNCSHKKNSR